MKILTKFNKMKKYKQMPPMAKIIQEFEEKELLTETVKALISEAYNIEELVKKAYEDIEEKGFTIKSERGFRNNIAAEMAAKYIARKDDILASLTSILYAN
jgi:hypothetical protein